MSHLRQRKENNCLNCGTKVVGRYCHNWLQKKLIRKESEFNTKYNHDQDQTISAFIESITHHFHQLLFVSLPFVALLLKLLYIRQKEFYYVSHGIFVLHLYIFVFIVMLFSIGLSRVQTLPNLRWVS